MKTKDVVIMSAGAVAMFGGGLLTGKFIFGKKTCKKNAEKQEEKEVTEKVEANDIRPEQHVEHRYEEKPDLEELASKYRSGSDTDKEYEDDEDDTDEDEDEDDPEDIDIYDGEAEESEDDLEEDEDEWVPFPRLIGFEQFDNEFYGYEEHKLIFYKDSSTLVDEDDNVLNPVGVLGESIPDILMRATHRKVYAVDEHLKIRYKIFVIERTE